MVQASRFLVAACLLLLAVLALPRAARACTLWAANGADVAGGGVLLVKNRDYPPGHPTSFALVTPKHGYKVMAMLSTGTGQPSMVGGVNEKGLAVITAAVGSIPRAERKRRTQEGGLVYPVRPMLERFATVREVAAAKDLLAGVRPIFAIVADAHEVAVLESSGKAWKIEIMPREAFTAHTNHPLLVDTPDMRQEPDAPGSVVRLNRIRELWASLKKPADLAAVTALAQDQADGPDRSILRTGSAPDKARTVGLLATWLPPDGGAPRVVIRVIDPLGARQAEAALALDAAFWRTAPPPGQSRILLQ
ncbi:MAG: penicillin V acylase-like amidase [Solidesulfovibrio magneticus str. Maddingley MBC34]|uniref:Penicillin V acylase-like amidase n=1 Tax=Solidesulfovibrio magneticus str. Maddingley MBC34 TaxID=1206767 RepID=K6GPR9_9BACT|nr:MAG: penicillin V acylase-like amidase [Solidesulfovibrio magneticus str. Maddingley MBC34]